VADGVERLLNVLIEREILRLEEKNVELTAGPRVSAETVDANQSIEADRERQRVHDLGGAFAAGLRRAYAAQQHGEGEIALDDRRQDENAMADALVQFLVRPHYATSQTDQSEPNHYIYRITVDWEHLNRLADETGIDLRSILRTGE
jgi:hypothetical protein